MVSHLTARLLKGRSTTSNSTQGSGCKLRNYSLKRDSGSSGYSADQEQTTGDTYTLPGYIDLNDGGLKRRGIHEPLSMKRRKLSELAYAASTVKADLARGGLPMPTIQTSNPLNLATRGVDFRNVKLRSSSDFSNSPFLNQKNNYLYANELFSGCEQLIAASSKSYEGNSSNLSDSAVLGSDKSDTDSSTSSFTASESDSGNTSTSPTNSALDIVSKSVKNRGVKRPGNNSVAMPITMKEALESCDKPRLVTLSFHPFIVVHANSEFTRLSGLSSQDVLGKPFRDVVALESRKLLDASFSVFSLHRVHNIIVNVTAAGNKERECLVKVSLVAAECKNNNVSHFSIDVFPLSLDTKEIEMPTGIQSSTPPLSTGSLMVG